MRMSTIKRKRNENECIDLKYLLILKVLFKINNSMINEAKWQRMSSSVLKKQTNKKTGNQHQYNLLVKL